MIRYAEFGCSRCGLKAHLVQCNEARGDAAACRCRRLPLETPRRKRGRPPRGAEPRPRSRQSLFHMMLHLFSRERTGRSYKRPQSKKKAD